MPRTKGSTNKITSAVKTRLQDLIDEVVDSIVVDDMTIAEKLKLLQLSLHYVVPKLRSTTTQKETEQEDEPLFINIHSRDENGDWQVETVESEWKKPQ